MVVTGSFTDTFIGFILTFGGVMDALGVFSSLFSCLH